MGADEGDNSDEEFIKTRGIKNPLTGTTHAVRDYIPGMLFMVFIVLWGSADLAVNIHRIITVIIDPDQEVTAFDCERLSNDVCSIILCSLVWLLWRTLCFKHEVTRHIWSWKPWIFPDTMMPGGFIPRPAAVSLGLLMFMSSVFLSERVVPGDKLFEVDIEDGWRTNKVAHGENCRADVREEGGYKDNWWSRLQRSNPSGCYFGPCAEGSPDAGCAPGHTGPSVPTMFNKALNISLPNGGDAWPNLVHPYNASSNVFVNMVTTIRAALGHRRNAALLSDVVINPDYTCVYQCVKWRVWGFNTVVSKAGTIFAGAGIVTKLTESVSGRLGSKRVTADTTHKELSELLTKIKPNTKSWAYKRFHKSALVPAVLFVGLRLFFAFWVFKIDDYGFFTVDYYVTQVIFFAIFNAILLRSCNPFRFERTAYTFNLWTKGSDVFVIVPVKKAPDGTQVEEECQDLKMTLNKAELKTIDLLVWMHMSHEERAHLLINYARMVSFADTKRTAPTEEGVVLTKKEGLQAERGLEVLSLCKHSHEVKVPLRITDVERADTSDDDFDWERCKVMEHKVVDVPFHAKGIVKKVEGEKVDVMWYPDQCTTTDGRWAERMRGMNNELDKERASTTSLNVHMLAEISEEWTKLMELHCGTEENQEKIKRKILRRLQEDNKMKGAQSWWQWLRGRKSTNDKESEKMKKKALASAKTQIDVSAAFQKSLQKPGSLKMPLMSKMTKGGLLNKSPSQEVPSAQ